MQLTKNQIGYIRVQFKKMQDVEDLVVLLNFAKNILYPPTNKTKQIQLKSITFYANYELSRQKRYKKFAIKKKNGGERMIYAPESSLKLIQRCLNLILTAIYEPEPYVMGFVLNKSIVDNARIHLGKKYVFNVDLKDFFPSIELYRIKAVLQLPPFSLHSISSQHLFQVKLEDASGKYFEIETLGMPTVGLILNKSSVQNNNTFSYIVTKSTGDIIQVISNNDYPVHSTVVCYSSVENKIIILGITNVSYKIISKKIIEINKREKLAFVIANLCCHVEDNEMEILPKYKVSENTYSLEYIDELKTRAFLPQGAPTSPIISNIICQKLDRRLNGLSKRFGATYTRYADDITFSSNKGIFNDEFKTEMRRIINDQRFTVNEQKVRLQGFGYRQEVTGLTVNEKVNVSKKYIREVRAMLNNWEKLGYAEAEKRFLKFYFASKSEIKKSKPNLSMVVWGKLQFLSMVRGKDDSTVKKYITQYQQLNPKPVKIDLNNISINDILSVWESKGIEEAMKLYYSNYEYYAEG